MHLNVWRELKTFPILKSQGRKLLEAIFAASEQFRHVHLKIQILAILLSIQSKKANNEKFALKSEAVTSGGYN